MHNLNKYFEIIKVICNYYGRTQKEDISILQDKDNKYLVLLLSKKYNCMDIDKLSSELKYKNKRSILYNIKKAEEKLLINKGFREKYFKIEEGLLK